MTTVVGFDRKIKREWLDALLDRLADEQSEENLRAFLHQLLRDEHPGETARGKTITVLMRIWYFVPPEHQELKQSALELLKAIPAKDRIWLHWGMCLLAYPLFRDTATSIGRLLKLQSEFTLGQLHRRLIDSWGERSTVTRAFQRVVRSMVEWQTLADAGAPGCFKQCKQVSTRSRRLQMWFLKASHVAAGSELVESNHLMSLPSSFPFKVTISKAELRRSIDFTLHRQGLDMDMVAVRNGSGGLNDSERDRDSENMFSRATALAAGVDQ